MKQTGRYLQLLLIGGGVILLDQVTKYWIHNNMGLYDTRPIISGFLDLHYIRNTGAAFGFLSGIQPSIRIPFFIGISVVAIGIILYLFHKMEESRYVVPVALSLVLGGAIGNLVDRVRTGEVVDFLFIHYKRFQWPAFNVADIAITVGVSLLILHMFFLEKRLETEPETEKSEKK